jgi:hypothetical protein
MPDAKRMIAIKDDLYIKHTLHVACYSFPHSFPMPIASTLLDISFSTL